MGLIEHWNASTTVVKREHLVFFSIRGKISISL